VSFLQIAFHKNVKQFEKKKKKKMEKIITSRLVLVPPVCYYGLEIFRRRVSRNVFFLLFPSIFCFCFEVLRGFFVLIKQQVKQETTVKPL
jgi:hypothetical protein